MSISPAYSAHRASTIAMAIAPQLMSPYASVMRSMLVHASPVVTPIS